MSDLSRPLEIVSIGDTALDREAMGANVAKYATTRDPSLLVFKEGVSPTWFVLQPIETGLFLRGVMREGDEIGRFVAAFGLAVKEIRALTTSDGRNVQLFRPEGYLTTASGRRFMWSDEELSLVSPAVVMEIGSVAFARSFLDPKAGGGFPPPPHWELVLQTATFRDAELTGATRPSSKSAKPPAGEPTDPSGEAGTAAGAKAKTTSKRAGRSRSRGSKP